MKFRVIYHQFKPDEYFIDGKPVTQKAFRKASKKRIKDITAPMLGGNSSKAWPMKSDALAVHPLDIPAAMARDRKHGIASEYDPVDGRMILKDRGQRREVLKMLGYHDNEGGYGDDHHVPHESKPAVDPRTVAACKFLDSLPVKGF